MKYIRTFEAYDENKHKVLNYIRQGSEMNYFKVVSVLTSFVDTLSNLNLFNLNTQGPEAYKAIKQSVTNRSGFNKLQYVLRELSFIKDLESPTWEDLEEYEFDIDKILEYLNSDDVIEYVQNDMNIKISLEELDEVVASLEEMKEMKDKKLHVGQGYIGRF